MVKTIGIIKVSNNEHAIRNLNRELVSDTYIFDRGQIDDIKQMKEIDGIIITGSSESVLDDKSWIDRLEDFVVNTDHPVLGVCWGFQLLAQALGGTVKRKQKRELGYHEVSIKKDHELVQGMQNNMVAFESHEDYVIDLPSNSTSIVSSLNSTQIFANENHQIYGVQFHPEVDYSSAIRLYNRYKNTTTVPEKPKVSVDLHLKSRQSSDILTNFERNIL